MVAAGSVRMLVETEQGGDPGAQALAAAAASLGGQWGVDPLFADPTIDPTAWVLSTDPPVPLTAQQIFQLAYQLVDQLGIVVVEPDLPVPAYAPDGDILAVGAFEPEPITPEQLAWPRKAVACPQAWARPTQPGGTAKGAGIRIGHPDTGYTHHPQLGAALEALDLEHDHDFVNDDEDAIDPLHKGIIPLTKFPGHGTGTSSVIVGQGDENGVQGVAPAATLVPIRAVNTVIQFFDGDVARAVEHARTRDCHVISMSLGGKGFFGLHRAIDRAIDQGMIVLAAAGNFVHLVTAPASYDNCLAIGATGPDDLPWSGSSRGSKVDISAPGGGVYGAAWHFADNGAGETENTPFISEKNGTSFAVAHVAGAAALWLGHHGRATLVARYPGRKLQAAFLQLLRTAGHRRPEPWGEELYKKYGVGILDIDGLLAAPLPDAASVGLAVGAFGAEPPSGAARLASSFSDLSEADVVQRLASCGLEGADVDRFAPEVLYHLMTDLSAAAQFAAAPVDQGVGAFAPVWMQRLSAQASPTLAASLQV